MSLKIWILSFQNISHHILNKMAEDGDNEFIRFKTTNRNTTTKERYLALTTDEIQLIRYMIGEITHCRRHKCAILSLLRTTITSAYASLSQWQHLQQNQNVIQIWLLLLCLSLLRSYWNEDEIRRIKTAYFNELALFVDDFEPTVKDDERNRTIEEMSEDHCKSYTRFKKDELHQLYHHLRTPETFRTPDRHSFTGEEALLIFLTRVPEMA